jgi:adenylosuccinate lyase
MVDKNKTLKSISPLDGRYASSVSALNDIFSEYALMKLRIYVEIEYIIFLAETKIIPVLKPFTQENKEFLRNIFLNFCEDDASRIKMIEGKTNHDVKSVEYFLQEIFTKNKELKDAIELIHFALTSEDINNISYALMLKKAQEDIIIPTITSIIEQCRVMAKNYANDAMLSHTHGQPATPTTMGKEIANTTHRLQKQLNTLKDTKVLAKLNGATGSYNAFVAVLPNYSWDKFSSSFIEKLGLVCNPYTTQIEPHDSFAEIFHVLVRINNILIDYNQDIWSYISRRYFGQKRTDEEVGSSTMPHKINPIDFENSEGNLQMANSLLSFFADKLTKSRLQRDLSDSTVLRNIGVAIGHCLLGYKSILRGNDKLKINKHILQYELEQNYQILAEPIQTMMRLCRIKNPYEKLKKLTRGEEIDKKAIVEFINNLDMPKKQKDILLKMTPEGYIGLATKLAYDI